MGASRLALACVACSLGACAELGVISDGTSISVGKPNNGYLVDAAKLPDHGTGFTTREVWIKRNNRFGTDELIDLVTGVARRMATQVKGVKLVVGDLSSQGGGGAFAFHRSHQSGRDADLVYYMRDAAGQPFEPDAMHVFDGRGRAKDGSGLTIDVPRTWQLVKELVIAPEAPVQYIFMYEPIAQLLIDHAKQSGEPEAVVARARRALRQPGDSARHDDHMHVRIYCSPADRTSGCIDIGPMELLAEREAERSQLLDMIGAVVADEHAAIAATTTASAATAAAMTKPVDPPPAAGPPPTPPVAGSLAGAVAPPAALRSLVRTRALDARLPH